MEQGKGKLGMWVGLCSAVPLVALAAVLLFNAPTLPVTIAAFAVLILIAPRLLAVASGGGSGDADRARRGSRNRAGQP